MKPSTATDLLILVSLGTDHHHFDRLVDWVDRWVEAQDGRAQVIAQVGTSKRSATGESHELMSPAALQAGMARADAVVCHGGPGTIMDARRCGREPIVVPRSPRLGEHVDDHQERFARWMEARGQLLVAATEAELHTLLDRLRCDPLAFRGALNEDDVARTAARFGDLVEGLLGDRSESGRRSVRSARSRIGSIGRWVSARPPARNGPVPRP